MRFTIEKVAKLTGISATTLRNWEKRYGFPCPERADSGHRFYNCSDLEFLKQVRDLVDTGHCLPEIRDFYQKSKDSVESRQGMGVEAVDDVDYRIGLLMKSLIQFDTREALGHYSILNAKLSPEVLFDRVFEKTLRRLECERADGTISVAQEHFASAFIRFRVASFICLDLPLTHEQKIVSATTGYERHEGGSMLVTAHLKFRGYPVHYFGPNLPILDLKELLKALKPSCVLLSYSTADRVLADLSEITEIKIPTSLGGKAFHDYEFREALAQKLPRNIHICLKTVGSEAASFVEMMAQQSHV